MDEKIYELIINSAKHPAGIAKIAEAIFNGKYKVHIIQRNVTWFEKEDDGTFKIIDDIIIRRRLSSDIANTITLARDQLKNNPGDIKIDTIFSNNKSLEVLNQTLIELLEKRKNLREKNKIDECRILDVQIKNAEDTLRYTIAKHDLYRTDQRDRIFSVLTEIENNLYNYNFKIKVVKELADILYQPNN